MFQENDARKEGDPVADKDCEGARIGEKKKKRQNCNTYCVFYLERSRITFVSNEADTIL